MLSLGQKQLKATVQHASPLQGGLPLKRLLPDHVFVSLAIDGLGAFLCLITTRTVLLSQDCLRPHVQTDPKGNTCPLLLEKSRMLDASVFCASVPGEGLSGKGSELPTEKVRIMQSKYICYRSIGGGWHCQTL